MERPDPGFDETQGPWGARPPPLTRQLSDGDSAAHKFPVTWPVLLLTAILVAGFVLQQVWPPARQGVLTLAAVEEGRAYVLVSHIFLHGSLAHLVLNAIALLQLGSVAARFFGRGLRAALIFFGSFLVYGVAGGLAFLALNPHGAAVGASGAICGLWGALARLTPPHTLASTFTGPVTRAFVLMNVIMVGIGLLVSEFQGAGIAWQAHLGGYVAGALLIIPTLRLVLRPARPMDRPS